jgi:hypothetical protein
MTTYKQNRHADWVAQTNMTKEEKRTEWISKARDFMTAAMELTIIWEHLDTEDNHSTSDNYPFNASFDEEVYAFTAWLEGLEEKWGK